jgi:sugar phosphate isomerase/epimerase
MAPAEALPIGVCSWSLRVNSVNELSDYLQKLGIRTVQIACGDPIHANWNEGNGMPAVARSADFVMTGAMLGFPGEDYTSPEIIKNTGGFGPPDKRDERIECLKWGLARTRELGLADLSLHAGFIPPVGSPHRRSFLDTIAKVGQLATDANVTVEFETGQEPSDLLKLTLEDLSCANLQINFDPANMLLYDMGDPLRAVELLAAHIRHVHVKDANRPKKAGEWGVEVPLGQGQVNIPAFVQALWRAGYRGPLCIEREVGDQRQRFHDIANGIDVLRRAIQPIKE